MVKGYLLSIYLPELTFCYLAFFINFFWEVLQTYFYTLKYSSFDMMLRHWLHCTGGDVVISLGSFYFISLAFRTRKWFLRLNRLNFFGFIIFGLVWTIISEWVKLYILKTWDYNKIMPIIPWIKVGLTPVLQWMVIPSVVILLVRHEFLLEKEVAKRGEERNDK